MHTVRNPRCPHCGYCLIGLTEHRCPECGVPFTPHSLRTATSRRITFIRVYQWLSLALLALSFSATIIIRGHGFGPMVLLLIYTPELCRFEIAANIAAGFSMLLLALNAILVKNSLAAVWIPVLATALLLLVWGHYLLTGESIGFEIALSTPFLCCAIYTVLQGIAYALVWKRETAAD